MGKSVHNNVLDAALNHLKNNVILETVCSTEPTTYQEATDTKKLADVVVDSGDFTVADGDVSGRKVTVAAQDAVAVDAAGTPGHVALCSADTLLYVTTCTGPDLTVGSTVNIGAFDIEIADPS